MGSPESAEVTWLIYAKRLAVANVRCGSPAYATAILKPQYWLTYVLLVYAAGIKPPDLIATIACSSCHDEIDRRNRLVDAEYAKECALEGMARTQVIWLKEGLIKS